MERFEIGRDDPLSELVDAFERGEQVEIVRDGTVVAHLVAPTPPSLPQRHTPQFDPAEWEALHRKLPSALLGGDAAAELRALRDAET